MAKKFDQGVIMKTLDWAYERAVDGVPGLDSAEDLGNFYLKDNGRKKDKANRLIRWQIAKAGTSGFLSGLGGFITAPVTLPANLASVMYVQIRMIAAIAHLGGYDIRDDRVKTLVYTCLCGNAAKDVLKDVGIKAGTKFTEQAIRKLSYDVVKKINRAVGFRLLTKYGTKGVLNLSRVLIPLAGGVIGFTMDAATTKIVGNAARKTFIT